MIYEPEEIEGWFDLAFEITAADEVAGTSKLRIEGKGESGHGIAGFGVEYDLSEWRRDQVSDDIWFDWGRGAIFSLGSESNTFARTLSSMIGTGSSGHFVDRLECDVVLINSQPDQMRTGSCRSKFFLGEADDEEAQVFVNYDIPAGRLEFREKDIEFRPNLVQHLVLT